MSTTRILALIAEVTWLFPLPFLFSSRKTPVFRWLFVCYLVTFLAELISTILYEMKINPNYGSIFYQIAGAIPITLFFYYAINFPPTRKPLMILTFVFIAFAIVNALFVQKLTPNYYTSTLHNIFIIVLCILYYYRLLNDLPVVNLASDPTFIIICGWFVTYCGKLVITVTGPYLFSILKDNMIVLWLLYNSLTLIGNFVVTYGAYLQFTRQRDLKPAPPQQT